MSIFTPVQCHKGEDVTILVTIDEDITGWSLTFNLLSSATASSPTVLATKSSPSLGITLTSPTTGKASVVVPSSVTTRACGVYGYVIYKSDAGSLSSLCHGTFAILPPPVA